MKNIHMYKISINVKEIHELRAKGLLCESSDSKQICVSLLSEVISSKRGAAAWESSLTIFRALWWRQTLKIEERGWREWPVILDAVLTILSALSAPPEQNCDRESYTCLRWCDRKDRICSVYSAVFTQLPAEKRRSQVTSTCSFNNLWRGGVGSHRQADFIAAEYWCSNPEINNKLCSPSVNQEASTSALVTFCHHSVSDNVRRYFLSCSF